MHLWSRKNPLTLSHFHTPKFVQNTLTCLKGTSYSRNFSLITILYLFHIKRNINIFPLYTPTRRNPYSFCTFILNPQRDIALQRDLCFKKSHFQQCVHQIIPNTQLSYKKPSFQWEKWKECAKPQKRKEKKKARQKSSNYKRESKFETIIK